MDYDVLRSLVSQAIPFLGKVGTRIDHIERGFARVSLPEDPTNTNHVGILHAGALFTLAETAGGVTVMSHEELLGQTFLIKSAEIRYLRRASGEIHAECRIPEADIEAVLSALNTEGKTSLTALVTVKDASGEVVAEFRPLFHLRKSL